MSKQNSNLWMIILTGIIAFATVVNVGVFYLASEDSSKQTSRLINEANKIAGSMQETVTQAKNGIGVSIRQNEATLRTATEKSRLEQRAWVGPIQLIAPEYLAENKKVYVKDGDVVKAGVIIGNSGKTPARKLHVNVQMIILKAGEKLVPKFSNVDIATLPHSNAALQPGAQFLILPSITSFNFKPPRIQLKPEIKIISEAEVSVKDKLFTKTDIDDLASGKNILYMFGLITYEDIFKQPHWTKFCMYLSTDLTAFTGCSKYNETDD
jgi:hypothetical protein